MLLIHGVYHFAPRRIAYRGDYCLACDAVQLAEQVKSFDVVHVWFVPLIPLGRRKHWKCSVCGGNPHERVRSTQGFKVLTAIAFFLFALLGWIMFGAIDLSKEPADLRGFSIGFPLVMTACFVAAVFWCRARPSTSLKQELPRVPPTPADVCIYCGGGLDIMGFCSQCRVQRLELQQTARPGIVRW